MPPRHSRSPRRRRSAALAGAVLAASVVGASVVAAMAAGVLPVRQLGSDGEVHGDVTVFDGEAPAVARLDPQLLGAVRRAASAAEADGVTFWVNSGWRSPEYQDELFRDAIAEYGSVEEAARWVATAETSPHVHGDAIDVGLWDATAWLAERGAAYGLCQIYGNEPWHYELRPDAADHGCPAMYPDASHDPRLQR
ncbi:M15 family metallopeptidase [Isoptericola sp. NEAU-Y5]|uniref:M15 family metallopeptidase n=1 Tax=Isoptericola luteus TaxID=2879484 RepID=A0ABS7ZI43_9MICO|nr:M15 family metallopeptidase [Isoptericola sp. NEAU-Y5]MCA5894172.1 M15 family metallopeptidase [Isoptericola sp. NEAU-Y5]